MLEVLKAWATTEIRGSMTWPNRTINTLHATIVSPFHDEINVVEITFQDGSKQTFEKR